MEKEPLVSDHPFVETVLFNHISNANMLMLLASYLSVSHPVVAFLACCLLFPFNRFSGIFFCLQLWQWHNAEQMILDHEEENPEKFKDKTYESTVDMSSFDEENRVEYTEGRFNKTLLKKKVVVCNMCSS